MTTRAVPDPIVVQRQNDLFDLYNGWSGDGDPDDDPAFVAAAREIMGLPPLLDSEPDTRESVSALDVLRLVEAAGHDITPGHDELHHYWTRDPRGRERWIHAPHPFYALVEQLMEHAHVPPEVAKRWAGAWYPQVFGYAPGSDINRVKHGKPPRGHRVGLG